MAMGTSHGPLLPIAPYGRGGYIPCEPFLADEGFRAALRRYVATKQGQKMRKYVPESMNL